MIISLRGTSGSGKSTIVRAILGLCPTQITVEYPAEEGRRRPQGQICERTDGRRLFVPGHYLIANGGIDTLPSLNRAYELILSHHEFGCDVLAEGKNMSDGAERVVLMHQRGLDVRVILLDTRLRECVASVRRRGHEISEQSISRTYLKCQRDFDKMRAAGVRATYASRKRALETVREWLEL